MLSSRLKTYVAKGYENTFFKANFFQSELIVSLLFFLLFFCIKILENSIKLAFITSGRWYGEVGPEISDISKDEECSTHYHGFVSHTVCKSTFSDQPSRDLELFNEGCLHIFSVPSVIFRRNLIRKIKKDPDFFVDGGFVIMDPIFIVNIAIVFAVSCYIAIFRNASDFFALFSSVSGNILSVSMVYSERYFSTVVPFFLTRRLAILFYLTNMLLKASIFCFCTLYNAKTRAGNLTLVSSQVLSCVSGPFLWYVFRTNMQRKFKFDTDREGTSLSGDLAYCLIHVSNCFSHSFDSLACKNFEPIERFLIYYRARLMVLHEEVAFEAFYFLRILKFNVSLFTLFAISTYSTVSYSCINLVDFDLQVLFLTLLLFTKSFNSSFIHRFKLSENGMLQAAFSAGYISSYLLLNFSSASYIYFVCISEILINTNFIFSLIHMF